MTVDRNYWLRTTRSRVTRRRALQLSAAGTGAAALSVLGCGGSDSEPDGDSSGLLYRPVDTTNKAVKGGVLPVTMRSDIKAFDTTGSVETNQAGHAYSRMVKYKAVKFPDVPTDEVVGDAAASWEISSDGLTYTFKVRPNTKFDPRPPTSGRVMTSADMKFSWDQFVATSPYAANLAYEKSPAAPVESVSTPDGSTFIYKLAFPYSPFNSMLAFARHSQIMPSESETFDMRIEPRGSGAWRLKTYEGASRIEWTKNTDWYDANTTKLDGITYYIVTEYSTGMSQFRAGALATYGGLGEDGVTLQDIIPTKRAIPELQMVADLEFPYGYTPIRFGYLPGSPFLDDRVRRAVSMLLDRDLVIETFSDAKRFTAEGLDVPARWHSPVPAGYAQFWLDPQDRKKFGEHAKWFTHDPAEARKLLEAAGQTVPLQTEFSFANDSSRTQQYIREQEVIAEMLQADGLVKFKINTLVYRTEFREPYLFGLSKVQGIYPGAGMAYPEVDGWLGAHYKSDGVQGGHLGPDGKPDANLDALIDNQRKELDPQRRIKLVHELQQYAAAKMFRIPAAGDALGFSLAWPWLGNWRVYNTPAAGGVPANETFQHLWIDNSKKSA